MQTRRALFLSPLALMLTAAPAAAQPWYEDRRRRIEYERWREQEMMRREREARRTRREWRREHWEDEREREAWARQQRWYR